MTEQGERLELLSDRHRQLIMFSETERFYQYVHQNIAIISGSGGLSFNNFNVQHPCQDTFRSDLLLHFSYIPDLMSLKILKMCCVWVMHFHF